MKKVLLWMWQLPQNICALIYKSFIRYDIISKINEDSGYTVYLTNINGGVTLGEYIFVYQKYSDLSRVVQHETGHVMQSRILGPLYLFIIGIPSLIHAAVHKVWCNKNEDYYHFFTEKWANKLAGLE